jgi:hypothetical protein
MRRIEIAGLGSASAASGSSDADFDCAAGSTFYL